MPVAPARRFPALCAAALVILLFLPSLSQAQENSNDQFLDLEMYWEMQSASNPQLSPDGSEIVYTRGWIDPKSDDRKSELWIMDADGERKRFLAEGSSATWSPDGTRIAYLAEGAPGGSQIYIRWMDDEGATSQITRMTQSPSNIRWSPDGESIAFNRAVKTPVKLTISMPSAPDGAEWTPPPKVVERPVYRRDRQGYVDDTYQH
ncbi:MAG: S9 family peptidase, partial [Bacteroidetes bacterium]|nr:S9 family peptidase [Bacteroidota bacterium]